MKTILNQFLKKFVKFAIEYINENLDLENEKLHSKIFIYSKCLSSFVFPKLVRMDPNVEKEIVKK